MEEYVTITEGARRLGVSNKRIQRAIKAGNLSARYPHTNKAEISMADLQAWHDSLHIRPGETQDRLKALETQVAELSAHVETLEGQLADVQVTGARKTPPKLDEAPPEGFTYLSDFCAQHFIPYRTAEDLFLHGIHGQKIKIGHRLYPMIGSRGRYDFWIQLHTRPDFRSCDDCPHEENGQSV